MFRGAAGAAGAAAGWRGAEGTEGERGATGGSGGAPMSEGRLPCAASWMSAARSGMLRIGRHSSRPSCQHSDSSVTAPVAALRRSSEMRTGPTGTPLIATYHSSVTLSSIWDGRSPDALEVASSTLLLNAPASAPPGATEAAGARGLAAERLVARPLFCGGRGAMLAVGGRGGAARTSIWCPHLRHFIRTVLPATFSSAIWYFALQLSQRNFTGFLLVTGTVDLPRKRSCFVRIRATKREALCARGGQRSRIM